MYRFDLFAKGKCLGERDGFAVLEEASGCRTAILRRSSLRSFLEPQGVNSAREGGSESGQVYGIPQRSGGVCRLEVRVAVRIPDVPTASSVMGAWKVQVRGDNRRRPTNHKPRKYRSPK